MIAVCVPRSRARASISSRSVACPERAMASRPRRSGTGKAVEQVEHALAPGGECVVGLEHGTGADDARPLERAEQDVICVAGTRAGQERLPAQGGARWIEQP